MAKRKHRPTEVVYTTDNIREAFEAAFRLYEAWDSPRHGPAVVQDVDYGKGGRWTVRYRPVSKWGKEAWS